MNENSIEIVANTKKNYLKWQWKKKFHRQLMEWTNQFNINLLGRMDIRFRLYFTWKIAIMLKQTLYNDGVFGAILYLIHAYLLWVELLLWTPSRCDCCWCCCCCCCCWLLKILNRDLLFVKIKLKSLNKMDTTF